MSSSSSAAFAGVLGTLVDDLRVHHVVVAVLRRAVAGRRALSSSGLLLGLVTYGETGEPFDPKVHEAVATSYSPDVTDVTLTEIFQPGYKVGDRILRPARVVVAEPATGPDGSAEPGAQAQQDQDNQ